MKEKYKKKDISNKQYYSEWYNNLDEQSKYMEDNFFRLFLGQRLTDIYVKVGLLEMVTASSTELGLYRDKEISEYVWQIPANIKDILDYKSISVIPNKLPMIVKAKPYDHENLGGYLSNQKYTNDSLVINKVAYSKCSTIKLNTIYNVVNMLGGTGFKINSELLDFLTDYERSVEWGLLYDNSNIEINKKDNKYERKEKRRLISQINLQNNILELADVFKKNTIYFPVRLDNRGRLYCTPHYLHYQSSELAKSLLMFSDPGIIKLTTKNSDYFLRIYGTNSFGNGEDKKSFNQRVAWVSKNLDNILNFENGILVKQANKKLLFLAFCIEYRRYVNAVNVNAVNEGEVNFKTHLPIQLDATCNGFQHLAMLSNETKLFKELNLYKSSKEEKPSDFYNYMLHRLTEKVKKVCESKDSSMEKDTYESYERLSKFILTRKVVKKALMVIPYNATKRTITKYMKEELKFDHYVEINDQNILEETKTPKNSSDTNSINQSIDIDDPNNSITNKKLKKTYISWWTNNDCSDVKINSKDICLCVDLIHEIISIEFIQISRLTKYLDEVLSKTESSLRLDNIAKLCNGLNVNICWNLPHGLTVKQGYLFQHSERIPLVNYNKRRITIKFTDNNK